MNQSGSVLPSNVGNLEVAIFVREDDIERQFKYKMNECGRERPCRYGHFYVTDRLLYVGKMSDLMGV